MTSSFNIIDKMESTALDFTVLQFCSITLLYVVYKQNGHTQEKLQNKVCINNRHLNCQTAKGNAGEKIRSMDN